MSVMLTCYLLHLLNSNLPPELDNRNFQLAGLRKAELINLLHSETTSEQKLCHIAENKCLASLGFGSSLRSSSSSLLRFRSSNVHIHLFTVQLFHRYSHKFPFLNAENSLLELYAEQQSINMQ